MQDTFVPTPGTVASQTPALAETPPPAQASPPAASVKAPEERPEQISKQAIDKRLRRVFTPRADGSYLVGEDFVKQYNSGDRQKLLILFEKCDHDPDSFGGWCWELESSRMI